MNRFFTILALFVGLLIPGLSTAQTIGGNISYTQSIVTAIDNPSAELTVSDATGFAPGDRVLVIQMQGGVVNLADNANFGQIQNPNGSAGLFEIATVCEVIGNAISMDKLLVNTYDPNGAVQVIQIPQYNNLIVNSELTTNAWNGTSGGVLILEATTIDLNADINMAGKGFRGGTFEDGNFSCVGFPLGTGITGAVFINESGDRAAAKGEGIGSYDHDLYSGYAPLANGAGGGNDHNTGGGGGSNISIGGRGGENGAGAFSFDCKGTFSGEPGYGLTAADRIYLGGGGGAGHGNNNQGSSGANGGGIVIIKAAVINGNGSSIDVSGNDADPTTDQINQNGEDGAGGGGAGGSIYLDIIASGGNINLDLSGGNGGDAAHTGNQNDCFGPGGGAAGGLVKFRGTAQSAFNVILTPGVNGVNSVVPGSGGITSCLGDNVDSDPGTIGVQFIEQGVIPEGATDNPTCVLTLPIELAMFQAVRKDQFAQLEWISQVEENISHFIIERASDGRQFNAIGEVAAQGFSNQSVDYDFLDESPSLPIAYYRLQIVELDGTSSYSEVEVLRFPLPGIQEYNIMPNPIAKGQSLTLRLESNQALNSQIRLFNLSGQLVWEQALNVEKGWQQIELNLPNLVDGMYVLDLINGQQIIREKLIISGR